jgi:hypothetical protein
MRESRIENALVRGVKRAGGEVRKLAWPGRRHAPDRLVFWPDGIVHFIELKAPGKKPRKGQEREFCRLEKFGHIVRVLDTLEKVNHYVEWWK